MFVKPRKNLFQLLREADNDDANDIMNTNVDQNTTNTDPGADNADTGEAESTPDDDLDINTNLDAMDDPNTTGDSNDDTTSGEGDDSFGTDDSSSSSDDSNQDEEVKKGNTDLFASLTAEEQAIKITELKRLYNDLYSATDDLLYKLLSMTFENVDPRIIVRIQSQMEELRRLLQDYIINNFAIKTYYENDINYSLFLSMFTTIRGVFDDIHKQNTQSTGKK